MFVIEQGIEESEEWDAFDADASHAVAWLGERVVGTGRLLPDGKIGRMAVLQPFRGSGVGTAIFNTLLEQAHEKGFATIRLSAQHSVIGFYRRWGFAPVGDPHDEVGIVHQWMELKLP